MPEEQELPAVIEKPKRKAPAIFHQSIKPEAKLNPLQRTMLADKIINYIMNGEPRRVCFEVIEQNTPVPLSNTGMQHIYEFAQKCIEEIVELDAAIIIHIHVRMYEKIYKYFREINNYEGMNKAMKGKEKMLGLNKIEGKVIKNKKVTIVINNTISYSSTALTKQKQDRYDFLIKKGT